MTRAACETCRFFDEWEKDGYARAGCCRRYPPRYTDSGQYGRGDTGREIPVRVRGLDWCGEYSAIPFHAAADMLERETTTTEGK